MGEINGIKKTPMAVTEKNRGLVQAAVSGSLVDQMLAGSAFRCCVATVTPTGTNDFMAFKNISNEIAVLDRLALTNATAEILTGSIAANYDITGGAAPDTSMNLSGALNALSAKMTVVQAVAISGTGAVLSVPLTFTTGAGTEYQDILKDGGPIIIPPQHTLTLGCATGGGAITTVKAELYFIAEPFIDG